MNHPDIPGDWKIVKVPSIFARNDDVNCDVIEKNVFARRIEEKPEFNPPLLWPQIPRI